MSHPPHANGHPSFIAVGDLMLGDSSTCVGFGLRSRYPAVHLEQVFARVRPTLQKAEVVFGNLECPLVDIGLGSTRWKRDQMRGDLEYATVLRRIGFNTLSVANNHAMQHGAEGFRSTVDSLESADIKVVGLRGVNGWCASPAFIDSAQGTVGLLGYSWRPRQYGDGLPGYAEGTADDVVRDIARLREQVEFVVVSIHWGDEFVGLPSATEVSIAKRFADAGMAVLVGHHPHVARPVVQVGNSIVAYSLGNFAADMVWFQPLTEGLMLSCQFDPSQAPSAQVYRVKIDPQYRTELQSDTVEVSPFQPGLSTADYERAISKSVGEQRMAAYWHAIKHATQFAPGVLRDLAATTVRNKLGAFRSRLSAYSKR